MDFPLDILSLIIHLSASRSPLCEPNLLLHVHPYELKVFPFQTKDCVFPLSAGLGSKESTCSAGDLGSVPGSGKPSGGGNGNPLQYSCLENPMDRGAWWAIVHGFTKSWTRLRGQQFHFPVVWVSVASELAHSHSSFFAIYHHFFLLHWLLTRHHDHLVNCCHCLVTHSVQVFCQSMDCSPPGPSVNGISQARVPEWVSIFFSKGSS